MFIKKNGILGRLVSLLSPLYLNCFAPTPIVSPIRKICEALNQFNLILKCVFFLQFLIIFRKAAAGELVEDSGLYELYSNMDEIDVDSEGVKGAAGFFESKVCFIHCCSSLDPSKKKQNNVILRQ